MTVIGLFGCAAGGGLEVGQHLRTVSGQVIGRNIRNLLVVMSTLDE